MPDQPSYRIYRHGNRSTAPWTLEQRQGGLSDVSPGISWVALGYYDLEKDAKDHLTKIVAQKTSDFSYYDEFGGKI